MEGANKDGVKAINLPIHFSVALFVVVFWLMIHCTN
jgi:hypothetical protein